MVTKTIPRERKFKNRKDNFDEGVHLYAGFYRQNPHRLALDYLNVNLFIFQQILIYMMDMNNFFMFIASRGQGNILLTNIVGLW